MIYISFFLDACTTITYIFTAPTCTSTIIILEPCALSVEFHISYTSLINNFTLRIPLKERIGAKAEEIGGEIGGDFLDNFIVFNSSKKRFQTGLPKYRSGML